MAKEFHSFEHASAPGRPAAVPYTVFGGHEQCPVLWLLAADSSSTSAPDLSAL